MSRSNTGVALGHPPGWFRIKSAAKYADVSERTIREWIYRGLKRTKIKGIALIKVEWLDEWLEQFQVNPDQKTEIKSIVNEVLKGL
jgi:hypothetical protein